MVAARLSRPKAPGGGQASPRRAPKDERPAPGRLPLALDFTLSA